MSSTQKRKVLSLYHSLLKTAVKFPQFNFRSYALNKIKYSFRESRNETDPLKIEKLLQKGYDNLELIERQTAVQKFYMNETNSKLVVE